MKAASAAFFLLTPCPHNGDEFTARSSPNARYEMAASACGHESDRTEPLPPSAGLSVGRRPRRGVVGNAATNHPRQYRRYHYGRHYIRYARHDYHHPAAAAAAGAAGALADLGSVAAYPLYCFPDYRSCPVHLPY